jgi:hypothetical protein
MKIQGNITKGSILFETFKHMNKNLGCYILIFELNEFNCF